MDKTLHTTPAPDDTPAASCCGSACGPVSIAPVPAPSTPVPEQVGLHRYRIANMDCASEESEIRRALEPIAGVKQLRFDLGQRTVSLAAEPTDLVAAIAAIERIGYKPQSLADPTAEAASESEQGVDHDHAHVESGLPRLIGALALAISAEALAFFAPETALLKGVQMLLSVLAIYLAGFGTYQKGLMALKAGRLNINALMTVAVTGAFVIGQWPEAAMVMDLYAIAELIEAKAVDRARNAIKSLLDLAPQDAEVQQAGGQWQRMPTVAVAVGAIVRLRPGERVPLDGVVTAGASAIDQAPVTGESVPVDKTVGDEVFAGTINQNAALEFRVTALATDSALARIIHAVDEAQATRAPT
ncbi:MAG: cation-translocating P-type ATPase, partial [Paucibacter sp.]|nr:cation-translocating P-type ATPase [Roseateles sp.]